MKRHELEHILRASAGITGAEQFVVIGSQAILGQFPDAPAELLVSREADVFTLRDPNDAELIDGSIGEESPFHTTFGYYAHGVGQETAVLPDGWRERLVPVHTSATGGATGLCLEVNDLAASKIAAGREKDLKFVAGLFRHKMTDSVTVRERLSKMPLDEPRRQLCMSRLERLSA